MNKAKILVLTISGTICVSIVSIIFLLISILSQIETDFEFNEAFELPLSYIQQQVQGVSTDKYLVTDVVDGDTIKVVKDQELITIRLIGIDAPEVKGNECMNEQSTKFLEDLILNKEVILENDPSQGELDRYSRGLYYIFINEENVNELMVSSGLAKEYTYNKAYKYQQEFKSAQFDAKALSLGVWSSECSMN